MKGAFYTITKEQDLTIEGQTMPVKVEINALFEEEPDLSRIDDNDLMSKIEHGSIIPSCIVVEAKALGLTGIDSLGGVLVERTEDITSTVADHCMVEIALDDLKNVIQDQIAVFKKVGLV